MGVISFIKYLPGPSTMTVFTLKGGSWVSTGDEASRFARYAFRRHFLQHLGFRLAQSTSSLPVKLCNAEVFVLGPGVSGKYLYE